MPIDIREGTEADVKSLHGKLRAFNVAATGRDDSMPLTLVAMRDGRDVGALTGSTSLGWLYIAMLVIDEDERRRGAGAMLLARAEEIAKQRGCLGSTLTTFSFQARGFYERHGYVVFGEIEDYPPPESLFFLKKRLDRA